ncbi:MAG: hypothetical protein JWN86_3699 [Planctomycetota bacterium]|nr:hypothetical protein [Planctomycetota bacterium]
MQMELVVNLVICVLILGMTYALSSEGAWGAILMFFNVMFAGLIAFNFYEPLAQLLAANASAMAGWADMICLLFLFLITMVILRVITDMIAPRMVRLPTPVYHLGRLLFGFATSAMTVGIMLCVLYTAPVHRRVFNAIDFETKPPFGQGLDRLWLAFVQFTTENAYSAYDEDGEIAMFDPRGAWLIDHQNARPYHRTSYEDTVPEPETPATAPVPAAAAAPKGQ